ncbi:ankyrin repeat-containing domain protein [Nemania abortiva]|nr:ankyrin repeat-containing domain protein [Nemania abortiva]
MEEIQAVPILAPGGLDAGPSRVKCPVTTVVMVHGLQEQCYGKSIEWEKNWLPQTEDFRAVTFSARDILSEDPSKFALETVARQLLDKLCGQKEYEGNSFTFWGQDFGGIVIKLALVIAAQDEKYRNIIERTNLVVLFGTPHRGSDDQTFESVILSVIETYSRDLLSGYLPRLLSLFSKRQEDIARRFSHISHRFGIISYYQASVPTQPSQVLVSETCATLGIGNEVKICRSRSHRDLPYYMSEAEAGLLRRHILNTRIAFWEYFTSFVNLISPGTYRRQYLSGYGLRNPILYHESFTAWLASENTNSKSIAFKTDSETDAGELLYLAALAVQAHQQALWTPYSMLCFPEMDEISIYASLIRQALIQQPQLFLGILDMVPAVVDSINGSYQMWKTRTLWLCLRTLLYTPTHEHTYGFLYLSSSTSIDVLSRLNSTLHYTECRYRLILALRGEDSHVDLSTTLVVNLGSCDDSPRAATQVLPGNPQIIEASLLHLSSQDSGLAKWALKGLIWIAFALRPLTVEELDLVLFLERPDSPRSSPDGSTDQLMQLISGAVKCISGRVFLTLADADSKDLLSRLAKPLLSSAESPHIQLACSCLEFLQAYILKYTQDTSPDSEAWNVNNVPMPYRVFAEYPAQNWAKHCFLGHMADTEDKDSAFSNFVANEKNIRDWLAVVSYFATFTTSKTSTTILDEGLKKHIDLKSLEGLIVAHRLAMRPSPVSGTGRLLVYAAECGNMELVQSLCMEIASIDQEAVTTAAAVTNGILHDKILKAFVSLDQDEKLYSNIQLRAQMLGNHETSDKLLSHLLDTATASSTVDSWFLEALQIAVEYQDDKTLCRLLKRSDLIKRVRGGECTRWTVLHCAANAGDAMAMTKLIDAGFRDCINVLSPSNHSPLTIASSKGLVGIVRHLLSKEALVDLVGNSEKTALHFASQYGFLETVTELLSKDPDITAADSGGNYALHLAIANRMTKIAELLANKLNVVTYEEANSVSDVDSQAEEMELEYVDADAPIEDNSNERREMVTEENQNRHRSYKVASAPLNRANFRGRTALLESAEQDMPSVAEILLQDGADPDILDDLQGTAIHLAAKMDASSIVEALISKGAALDLQDSAVQATPLHYSCYRGHLKASLQLIEARADIGVRDYWNRTPLSAACMSGHLTLVQSLLRHYKPELWPESLVEASKYGCMEIAKYLLDEGCPVNSGITTETNKTMAILEASNSGQSRTVELLLLRGADVEARDSAGNRAIHKASQAGFLEVIKLLIDRGADLEVEDSEGRSPLCIAIYYEHHTIVDLLLRRGAILKTCHRWDRYNTVLEFSWVDDGFTPVKALIAAIDRHDKTFMSRVLETWYNDTTEDLSIGKAIHYAASQNDVELLRILLDHSLGPPSINYEVSGIGTPLHAAIRQSERPQVFRGLDRRIRSHKFYSSLETVRLLLEKGADVELVSGPYGTTLNQACVAANIEIAKLLIDRLPTKVATAITGRYGTPVQSAIVGFKNENGDAAIEFLHFLEEKGISPVAQGGIYGTPLHAALDCKLSVPGEVGLWLIEKANESLCHIDTAGRLPLHLSIRKGSWDLVQEILNHNQTSKVSSKDKQGLTGLHYAAMSNFEVIGKILKLEGIKALINARDIDDWTPLHWACREGSAEVVKTLVEGGADVAARTIEGWSPWQVAILHGNDYELLEKLLDSGSSGINLPERRRGYLYSRCNVCYCTCFLFTEEIVMAFGLRAWLFVQDGDGAETFELSVGLLNILLDAPDRPKWASCSKFKHLIVPRSSDTSDHCHTEFDQ